MSSCGSQLTSVSKGFSKFWPSPLIGLKWDIFLMRLATTSLLQRPWSSMWAAYQSIAVGTETAKLEGFIDLQSEISLWFSLQYVSHQGLLRNARIWGHSARTKVLGWASTRACCKCFSASAKIASCPQHKSQQSDSVCGQIASRKGKGRYPLVEASHWPLFLLFIPRKWELF